jgi:hypothetical protein
MQLGSRNLNVHFGLKDTMPTGQEFAKSSALPMHKRSTAV